MTLYDNILICSCMLDMFQPKNNRYKYLTLANIHNNDKYTNINQAVDSTVESQSQNNLYLWVRSGALSKHFNIPIRLRMLVVGRNLRFIPRAFVGWNTIFQLQYHPKFPRYPWYISQYIPTIVGCITPFLWVYSQINCWIYEGKIAQNPCLLTVIYLQYVAKNQN